MLQTQTDCFFLNKLAKKVNRLKQGPLIWCGDFIGINDASVDSTSRGIRPPLQLGTWISNLRLFDAWRCYHANERGYTFYSPVHKSFSRIDFFLVDRLSLLLVTKCDIGTTTWSDHASITLSLQLSNPCTAPFMWKNNTYLLKQPDSNKHITSKLEEFFALNAPSVNNGFTLWNAHKAVMRGILIQISSRWKRERSKLLDTLLILIKLLEEKLQQSPSIAHHRDLLDARLKLREHLISDYRPNLQNLRSNTII